MMFTETGQTPWMSIAAAATAAPSLTFSTGIAVAFPISPMIAASIAWELAGNTGGRFRLGLGSQVKAHIERRYGVDVRPARSADARLPARRQGHAGRVPRRAPARPRRALLPAVAAARSVAAAAHDHGDIKVDVSAVGPWMTTMAGEVADGVHVHPLHSVHYLEHRLVPAVRAGAERGRSRPPTTSTCSSRCSSSPATRPRSAQFLARRARTQIGFYGSTKNYAFQFDDLGFEGTSARLNERLKAGDQDGLAATITDEMLDAYAIVGRWDEIADRHHRALRRPRRAGRSPTSPSTTSPATPTTSAAGARSPAPCATPRPRKPASIGDSSRPGKACAKLRLISC